MSTAWPDPPPLGGRAWSDQTWSDLLFLHWRIDPARVAPHLPVGCRPDLYDGSSWIGLIGFRMERAGLGRGHPVPYLGTFGEINVRLYSVDAEGRRGVVFASLETERLLVTAATNLVGVRYRWARVEALHRAGRLGYRSRRIAPPRRGARTDLLVETTGYDVSDDPLAVFLTARWGMHTRVPGRTAYVPNEHRPWRLHTARLQHCRDELLAAAGFADVATREPDSVLWSPGVQTVFGRPYLVG